MLSVVASSPPPMDWLNFELFRPSQTLTTPDQEEAQFQDEELSNASMKRHIRLLSVFASQEEIDQPTLARIVEVTHPKYTLAHVMENLPSAGDFLSAWGDPLAKRLVGISNDEARSLQPYKLLDQALGWQTHVLQQKYPQNERLTTIWTIIALVLRRKRFSFDSSRWAFSTTLLDTLAARIDPTQGSFASSFLWMLFELQRTTSKAIPSSTLIRLLTLFNTAKTIGDFQDFPSTPILFNLASSWARLARDLEPAVVSVSERLIALLKKPMRPGVDIASLGCPVAPFTSWVARALSACFYNRSFELLSVTLRLSALAPLFVALKRSITWVDTEGIASDQSDESDEGDSERGDPMFFELQVCIWVLRAVDSIAHSKQAFFPTHYKPLRLGVTNLLDRETAETILSCALPRGFHPLFQDLGSDAWKCIHTLCYFNPKATRALCSVGLSEVLSATRYFTSLFPAFYKRATHPEQLKLLSQWSRKAHRVDLSHLVYDQDQFSTFEKTEIWLVSKLAPLPKRAISSILSLMIPIAYWTHAAAACAIECTLALLTAREVDFRAIASPYELTKSGSYECPDNLSVVIYYMCRAGLDPAYAMALALDWQTDGFYALRSGPVARLEQLILPLSGPLASCSDIVARDLLCKVGLKPYFLDHWFPIIPGDLPAYFDFWEHYKSLVVSLLFESSPFSEVKDYQQVSYQTQKGERTAHVFVASKLVAMSCAGPEDYAAAITDAIAQFELNETTTLLYHASDEGAHIHNCLPVKPYNLLPHQDFGSAPSRCFFLDLRNAIIYAKKYYGSSPIVTIVPVDHKIPSNNVSDCIFLPEPEDNPSAELSEPWVRAILESRAYNYEDELVFLLNRAPAISGPMMASFKHERPTPSVSFIKRPLRPTESKWRSDKKVMRTTPSRHPTVKYPTHSQQPIRKSFIELIQMGCPTAVVQLTLHEPHLLQLLTNTAGTCIVIKLPPLPPPKAKKWITPRYGPTAPNPAHNHTRRKKTK